MRKRSNDMNIPVAFFAYNRPYHSYETLKSLSLNKEAKSTDIYAFIDGHKKNSEINHKIQCIKFNDIFFNFFFKISKF